MIRTLATLLVQEFYRPRPPVALSWLVPDVHPLTPKQNADLLDQMDGDLFRAVRANVGGEPRNTQEIFDHLAPRRRNVRKVAS
jgi:hypothetical protein